MQTVNIDHANPPTLGGGGGTSIATAGMRVLPFGVPKMMVSTVAADDMRAVVGPKDVIMMPSIVDVAGINRISARVYANAAGAIAGMLGAEPPVTGQERPLITASMFGNTTPCVDRARGVLSDHGYEMLVFHATGIGGRTMEGMIADGYITALTAPAAALWSGAARGWQVDGGLRPGPARDGWVYVLYGSRPDLVGWAATVAGRPGSELLSHVRHF